MPDESRPTPVTDELSSDYANNVRFEASVWDLKLIFGEYSSSAPQSVEWHTSMTVPWAQAKLMLYYLEANVIAHELVSGKISMPEMMLPPEWDPPAKDSGVAEGLYERLVEVRNKFLESTKK